MGRGSRYLGVVGSLRISPKDAKVETAADLRTFTILAGRIGTRFALAPDGNLILFRELDSNEIYSLSYSER